MTTRRNHALLIGVENYLDKEHLPRVAHAEADVAALRLALIGLGYRDDEVTVLVGEQATKTSLEHHVRVFLSEKHEGGATMPLFFFVGYGCAVGSSNFLLCRDTYQRDIESTGIDLGRLIQDIKHSPHPHFQIYLDCRSDEPGDEPTASRSLIAPMSEPALERALQGGDRLACFLAARFDQKSYSSDLLKHGIWTYHLVQALGGQAPAILDESKCLRVGKLQDYLSEQVAKTVRDTFTTRKKQTPWYGGGASRDGLVADLSAILQRKSAGASVESNTVKGFVFRGEERVAVRALSGFKPGVHKLPKRGDRRAEEWIIEIAKADIEEDLAKIHASLRATMKYTRKQIEVSAAEPGSGSIRTPDFEYTISVAFDDDFTKAVFTRELSEIRHPDVLSNAAFNEVFNGSFAGIRLCFETPLNVEDLIDKAEAQSLKVDYPLDCSSCTFKVADGGVIRVTEDRLTLGYPAAKPLKQLATALIQAIGMLPKGENVIKALPRPTKRPKE